MRGLMRVGSKCPTVPGEIPMGHVATIEPSDRMPTALGGARGHVDDRTAAPLEHLWYGVLAAEHDPAQVDGHRSIPDLDLDVGHVHVGARARIANRRGVVVKDVELVASLVIALVQLL